MEERPEVEEGSQPKQSEADSPIPLGGLPSSLVQSRRPPTPPLKTKPTRQQFTFASKTRLSDGGFYAPLSHPPEISPTSLLSLESYQAPHSVRGGSAYPYGPHMSATLSYATGGGYPYPFPISAMQFPHPRVHPHTEFGNRKDKKEGTSMPQLSRSSIYWTPPTEAEQRRHEEEHARPRRDKFRQERERSKTERQAQADKDNFVEGKREVTRKTSP